jgi:hypothetical protein
LSRLLSISVQISALSFAVGTFMFLSAFFMIHLHRFEPVAAGFGANLRFILRRRNIVVPIETIYDSFAPIWAGMLIDFGANLRFILRRRNICVPIDLFYDPFAPI